MTWQPIETAGHIQQDGTPVLLFARYWTATAPVRVVGHWLPDEGWVALSFAGHGIMRVVPSHWHPLPDFPSTQGAAA